MQMLKVERHDGGEEYSEPGADNTNYLPRKLSK